MYNGDMFTITPMNQQIVLEAGKIYEGSITIINSTDATKDFNYRVSVAPYNVTDEDYTADLETMYSRSDIVNWIKNHLPSQRRLIQLYAALLHNAYLKGYITGDIFKGVSKSICMPGLNCYSCPGAIGSCPLGTLQNSLAEGKHNYILGILGLFGLMLGRTICGFLCPMGLLQELLYKIKTPKLRKSMATKVLSYLKYFTAASNMRMS